MKHKAWLMITALLLVVVPGVSANAPLPGRAGRAEVRFLEGMMDHHQMALDMAQDCVPKAATTAVKTLCEAVIAAQQPEIELMQGWLAAWYAVAYTPAAMYPFAAIVTEHAGHGGSSALATYPAMMMGMMAGLNRLSGTDYDVAWLEAMIDHHDDALHMAERILKLAQHEDLRTLAAKIIADQTAEIERMETLIRAMASKQFNGS